jgi:hypothetical protein
VYEKFSKYEKCESVLKNEITQKGAKASKSEQQHTKVHESIKKYAIAKAKHAKMHKVTTFFLPFL